jgi:hypothetical protein
MPEHWGWQIRLDLILSYPVSCDCRDANVEAVLTPLIDFANSTALSSLSPSALKDLVSEVRNLLKPQAIKDWGKLLAAGHKERVGGRLPPSMALLWHS